MLFMRQAVYAKQTMWSEGKHHDSLNSRLIELKGVTLEPAAHLHTHDTNSKYARDISHLGEFTEGRLAWCVIFHPLVILRCFIYASLFQREALINVSLCIIIWNIQDEDPFSLKSDENSWMEVKA